ncbi:MAG: DUF664 domain-containing protein, partial [Acidimicrobiales bacterium]
EDWELTSAVDDEPVELYALFVAACDRSRAVLEAAASLDDEADATNAPDPGQELSLRWILVHLIEEYARHAGHADLLREALDGRTGFA